MKTAAIKQYKPLLSLAGFVLALVCLVICLLAYPAQALGDDRQCSVTFTTGAAGTTASPSSGTCNWVRGSTLLMQCDQDVYFSSTATATANDFQVKFSINPDPYIIYQLDTSNLQKDVSVLGVTASGTCKFAKTNRRKPI
jgi:hypothetical protein